MPRRGIKHQSHKRAARGFIPGRLNKRHLRRLRKLGETVPQDSQEYLKALGLPEGNNFRNEAAYAQIQEVFPSFRVEVVEKVRRKKDGEVTIKVPVFHGMPCILSPRSESASKEYPSLADLMHAVYHPEFRARYGAAELPASIVSVAAALLELGEVGQDLLKTLQMVSVDIPSDRKFSLPILQASAVWLQRAKQGQLSTIFAAVCPDYATKEGRYTFESLGNGVGLVASRALRALPILWEFAKRHQLPIQFVVAIGDFEAHSEETCKRVKVTREEFVSRCRESQKAFKDACPSDMPVSTPLVTDIAPNWSELMKRAQQHIQEDCFGPCDVTQSDLQQICRARESLYKRWYGDSVNVLDVLRRQAPEYMAMGAVADQLPNAFVFGADAPAMAIFWQGLSSTWRPVMYLKRTDY